MVGHSTIFATIKPFNARAKLDFHHLIEQEKFEGNPYVHVDRDKRSDVQVFRFLSQSKISATQTSDDCVSMTSTECETDAEDEAGLIYHGHYVLDLKIPPIKPLIGWKFNEDLKLGYDYRMTGMRSAPAILNFHHRTTGYLSLLARVHSRGSTVAVNGTTISHARTFSLNQNPMRIFIGPLEYVFEYTTYASSEMYIQQRKDYFNEWFGGEQPIVDIVPTPLGQVRTIGEWTFSCPLGKGSFGRVYCASNCKGQLVVIKLMNGKAANTKEEIKLLERLNPLASSPASQGRFLRLVEVIQCGPDARRAIAPFDEVALVLAPCAARTFEAIVRSPSAWSDPLSRRLFKDLVEAVNMLHKNGFIHRDLKPANIGITHESTTIVLLDLGGAAECDIGQELEPRPGTGGTIGYLAPEYETRWYDHKVDMWSLGIILFEIVYGTHPWRSAKNPWRPDHLELQAGFMTTYEQIMLRLRGESLAELRPVCDLLMLLLRMDPNERISCDEASRHEALRDTDLEAQDLAKRSRV